MGIEAGFYPDHYEGSYIDIFSHVNFNFLGTYFPSLKKKVGRTAYPVGALLAALVLKALMPGGAYRSVESRLEKDRELKLSLGFGIDDTPSDSIVQQFFGKLEVGLLYEVIRVLLEELRLYDLIRGDILAQDSTPIEAHNRPPTKKCPRPKDPDAAWGFAKCKDGYYYGYKAQTIVDAETNLPVYPIVTPANVSDQIMVEPFIAPLKAWGFSPKYFLADKGYDSGANHRRVREEFGSIGLIAVNKRRGTKKYSRKVTKKYIQLMKQTVLDKFIPLKKREKEYRKCCIVLLDKKPWKRVKWRRIISEQVFSRMKETLELERVKVWGLENVTKYVQLKCIAMLTVALAAARMGRSDLARCIRYFQN